MDLEIDVVFSNAERWIAEYETGRRSGGAELRAALDPELLARFEEERDARRASPESIQREQERAGWERRSVRDGCPVDDSQSVCGFYGWRRTEGEFAVSWGNDPGQQERWRLFLWKCGKPVWTCSVNLRITDCWVAHVTGDVVARVVIAEQDERSDDERRMLFIVFTAEAEVREYFQMREHVDRFLGIDEGGNNYVWSRSGVISLSSLPSHREWYRWAGWGTSYWNSGRFASDEKRVRLYSSGGTVLELCWEDAIEDLGAKLREDVGKAVHPSERLQLIRSEWDRIATDAGREEAAKEMFELLASVSAESLATNSWYGWGPMELLRLKVDLLQYGDDQAAAVEAQRSLAEWETAIVFPNVAVSEVKAAIEAGNTGELGLLESKIERSLENRALWNLPEMHARVWRAKGHLGEWRGDLGEALSSYRKAVDIWHGVGCLRDSQRLEKKLRGSTQ